MIVPFDAVVDVAGDAGVVAARIAVALEHVDESRANPLHEAGDSMVRATLKSGGLSRDVAPGRAGVRSSCGDRSCGRQQVLHTDAVAASAT